MPNFRRVSAELRASVVSVVSERPAAQGGSTWGMGSGTVVQGSRVLTNAHVIAKAHQLYVELPNGSHAAAKVLAIDPRIDLALLRVKADPKALATLQPVRWSQALAQPGQWAMCMGHPYGLGHTVTVGVVSGLGRDYRDMGSPAALDPKGLWSMLQLDAAINVGNSGGPVVDLGGRVLGLATATRLDAQGLAFAVPSAMAQHFVSEVLTYGRMRRARLGARIQEVGPLAFPGRLKSLQVESIAPKGPAKAAGLAPGDIILAIQDRPLHRLSTLQYEIQLAGVGASLTLTVSPKGQKDKLRQVTLQLDGTQ